LPLTKYWINPAPTVECFHPSGGSFAQGAILDVSYILIAISALAAVLLVLLVKTYNGLVRMRNNVRNGWSDIDVQLTRRHDLVPNLVESVKGYMTHERETLEAVTRARTQAMAIGGADLATRAVAEMALGGAVGNLFAVAERYPTLKASPQFLLLQEQLTSTENRIAYARQHYNECVRQLNTALAEFPRNLVAGLMGFTSASLFAADAGDRAVAEVRV
jgi:LemA protein